MDILRKELTRIYASQSLDREALPDAVVGECRRLAAQMVSVNDSCAVVTDAATDTCFIYAGALASLLGLTGESAFCREVASSDEDIIYNRMHPEDLVEKRMLEYEFFRFIDPLDADGKTAYKASCRIRIRDRRGGYRFIDNTTQVMRPSPEGKIWLILCCYALSTDQEPGIDTRPRIVNTRTGEMTILSLSERKNSILTPREKEVLRLIRDGLPSKQIADALGISIFTVNRHRQNILEKLSVGNSVEAITAASSMGLI